MAWTPNAINLLFIGWLVWLVWVVFGPLLWVPTSSYGWDRVPKLLSGYERAARRRVEKIPLASLPSPVREVAIVLEARERWLTWRLLAVVFSGLLASLLPLTLITFLTPPTLEGDEPTRLKFERLPSALGVVTVAVLPLIVTAIALVSSASRLSRSWPSDAEVWRHLNVLLRDEACSSWHGPALRRPRSLRNLAAALERDFMRMAAVSDPSQLHRHQRAVVGGVLDQHDRLIRQPSRTVTPALLRRFAGGWLSGDWSSLHRGTVRDRPALPQREPWPRRRGVVIAIIAIIVVYMAMTGVVFLVNYDGAEAWSTIIGVLITPLIIVVLGVSVRSWEGSMRSRNHVAPTAPRSGQGSSDERDDQDASVG